jgi:hypothetical protein
MEMSMILIKSAKRAITKRISTRALPGSIALALLANVAHAQTTVDTTSMTEMISAFLPIIMSLFAILIPLMFFGKIMEFFERLLKSFS